MRHHVLVIGCGSIGERHVRTFLGTQRAIVVACDNRSAISEQIARQYGIPVMGDWEECLRGTELTAVVVATPAPLHVAMATRALAARCHVLIEKPLALDLTGTEQLCAARDEAGVFAAVAYVNHCVTAVAQARDYLRSGVLGAVRHVAITAGQHFPEFRPGYRDIYYRDRAQGGGAIQDALTHQANAVEWILGETTQVFCDAAHQVLAGVEVEDTVNVVARNGGALVTYALNQFQAPNESRWDFHAEKGSVRIEGHAQRWGWRTQGSADWSWQAAPVPDRDAIYLAQANAFLDGCEGRPQALCTLEEGIRTLRFNLAAFQSWQTNRLVEL
jgi:predicted dehydrogenase